MSIFDGIEEALKAAEEAAAPHEPLQEAGQVTPPPINQPAESPPPISTVTPAALPDRTGTFIIPDVYPEDPTGANPPFHNLVGLSVMGKEVVGAIIKCSEGTGWGAENEEWFVRNWQAMAKLASPEFMPGCYHFLRFQEDGAAQADYFCDLVERAGGWGPWDLMPWCDIEEGGQGTWAGGEKLESITDPAKRIRLAAEINRCATAFVTRFKQRTGGLRIAMYGRGVMRDLHMVNARFGCDSAINPAYTTSMPDMTHYGWPLSDVSLWQACGDGECYLPGYPKDIPGWGPTDWSVYVDGNNATTLGSLRTRCLAKSP